jgi:hypothetical protein
LRFIGQKKNWIIYIYWVFNIFLISSIPA